MEVLHENQDLQGLDYKGGFGVDCLPAVKNEVNRNPNFGCGFQAIEGEDSQQLVKRENREIWVGHGDVSNGDIDADGDGDPSSLFYAADDFPPLPEFPCMSSSSSTSSTPVPSTATVPTAGGLSTSGATSICSTSSSSSSSAASWAVLKSEAEADDDYQHQDNKNNKSHHVYDQGYEDGMDGVDCINVMEDFDCMGINQLIEDSNEIWDPSPLFETTENQPQLPHSTQTQLHPFDQFPQQKHSELELHPQEDDHPFLFLEPLVNNREAAEKPESASALSEDLAVVFFEWLKSNKESISAEELRSIKIKKSTIESAAKRLGGGKEGMKQLLKLILQWVQNHRLHTKRSRGESAFDLTTPDQLRLPQPLLLPNQESMIQHEPPPPPPLQCFNPPQPLQPPQPWISPYVTDPAVSIAHSSFTSMVSYIGGHDPYPVGHQSYHAPPPPDPYHMIDGSMTSWAGQLVAAPQFPLAPPPGPMHYNTCSPDGSLLQAMGPQGFPGHGAGYNPYPFFPGPGDGLMRMGSSATKEARKKRMARQRRVFTHHHHRSHGNPNQQHGNGSHQQQMIQSGCADPNSRAIMGDHDSSGSVAHGGWVYWPPAAGGSQMMGSMPPQQQQQPERTGVAMAQGGQRLAAADKKQGFKTEKNLKFLLQKVLKQSDVGNLGRIVLPKKEAETHLPELEARDGIPIAMEDIGTSRVWNMRYRFWPNNKSRMYLLENTGDFVRSNGLQEGDFIVIYSDVKCGKYMIRGVKVRPQQQGPKPEQAKKPSKAQKTQNSASPADSTHSPVTQRQ